MSSADYFAKAWKQELAARMKASSFLTLDWKVAGRATKANPNKEDGEWWQTNGPKMVDSWIKWRTGENGWQIWELPNNQPAIEVGVTPIWNNVPVQMHIDRVMVTPDGELVVVDIKTGQRTPTSDLQLAFYAAGLEELFGVRPKYGTYWMARKGITSDLIDLDYFNKEKVVELITKFDTARKAGVFLPNFNNCNRCSFIDSCEWNNRKVKEEEDE